MVDTMEYTIDYEDGKFIIRYVNQHVYGVCESPLNTDDDEDLIKLAKEGVMDNFYTHDRSRQETKWTRKTINTASITRRQE